MLLAEIAFCVVKNFAVSWDLRFRIPQHLHPWRVEHHHCSGGCHRCWDGPTARISMDIERFFHCFNKRYFNLAYLNRGTLRGPSFSGNDIFWLQKKRLPSCWLEIQIRNCRFVDFKDPNPSCEEAFLNMTQNRRNLISPQKTNMPP